MLKKTPAFTLVFSVFLFILLFANVGFVSAQESESAQDCEGQSVSEMGEILRLGLTPSLRMTSEVGLSSELRMTEAGIPNPYSLIPNPSLSADSDKETSKDGYREAMFRLYNKWTGEHFYTSSTSERDDIVKKGWTYEEIGWYAPTQLKTVPVYRLYNPYVVGGDHHYTTSAEERDYDVKAGWSYEGIAWYSVPDNVKERVPVLRQYNPYAKTGTHNYTTAQKENDHLVSLGWKAEGIGWYGYDTIEPTTQAIDFTKAVVDQSDKTYNSKAFTPSATVTGLTAGTDYTVTYKDNVNAGTGKITITGKGSYTGSKVYSFKINPLNISTNSSVTLGTSLTYNANEQEQTVAKVTASGLTLAASDYTLTNNKGTNAGTYTLKVTGKGNFTGLATKEFSINKANPIYHVPEGLKAYAGDLLSAVALPEYGEASEYTLGKWVWDSQYGAEKTVGNIATTVPFKAAFVPNDSVNYNQSKTLDVYIEVLPVAFNVTFVANAPSDQTATVDGNSDETVVTWAFDTKEVASHTIAESDFPTTTINDTNYFLAGWTTDSGAEYGSTQKQLIGTTIDSDKTYYAVWKKESGYWLGTSGADKSYSSEADFAQKDVNYHSSLEVVADMKVLHDDKQDEYASTLEKWNKYYTDDTIRLYATYQGGENEGSYDASSTWKNQGEASELNKYIEFRILEVSSSVKGHNGDGSAVTFMATHLLPTAYPMNPSLTSSTNVGGWGASNLMTVMNSGEIYNKFSSDFREAAMSVSKEYNTGNKASQSSDPSVNSYQLWILSYSELVDTNALDYSSSMPKSEGIQYQWCKTNVKNANGTNTSLAYTTRAGKVPGMDSFGKSYWWERSPEITSSQHFGGVNPDGHPSASFTTSNSYRGITVAFCF